MSSERVPSRSEVMGWGPQQLADYLRRMNLSGSDKVVIKHSITGSRFLNLSENDIQKFPKLQAPLISKFSTEISRKEERRGLFPWKPSTKYHEPAEVTPDDHWPDDEFDDDDYEKPYSGDEEGSGSDYESPNDDDYEPTPSEPPEDLSLLPTRPIGDSEYIDNRNNHVSSSGLPPVVCPRPTLPTHPMFRESSRRDNSPHSPPRPAGKILPEPPQISRNNKPGRVPTSSPSQGRGPHVDRPSPNPWKPQQDAPNPPTWYKPPPQTSARTPSNRFEAKRDMPDEAQRNNTFPLPNKSMRPCPGLPGPSPGHGDR